MTKAYAINGMHCGSCVAKVTEALRAISINAVVTLQPPRAVVEGDNIPDLTELNNAWLKV